MALMTWNLPGERSVESGVSKAALYVPGQIGVPWNGLVSVDRDAPNGSPEPLYFEGRAYAIDDEYSDFQATITAFHTPKEFGVCEGRTLLAPGLWIHEQAKVSFSMVYRTEIATDLVPFGTHYKLHLLYNLIADPAGRGWSTLGDQVNPSMKSMTVRGIPPTPVFPYRPGSYMVVSSRDVTPTKMANLEEVLYGSATVQPSMPLQNTVVGLLS